MWTLHQLNALKPTLEEQESVSQDPEHGASPGSLARIESSGPPWGFSPAELEKFPALKRRNFWCVQRHQARALHYDLRLQVNGATFSWAIPKGLLGMTRSGEKNRIAVETTLHPISYTTFEGSDGRRLPSGKCCGTLLWDIGVYKILPKHPGSDSEEEKRRKRRRVDDLGADEEYKLSQALRVAGAIGRSTSIHLHLGGGRKLKDHSYVLVLPNSSSFSRSYTGAGTIKRSWLITLPADVHEYSWGEGGEEGRTHGRSVKSGRTLEEVCAGLMLPPDDMHA